MVARGVEPADGESAQDAWVEIGRVLRPHALDGRLLVTLLGDDCTNLLRASTLRLEAGRGHAGRERKEFRVLDAAAAPSARALRARVRLEGIDARPDAERWVGAAVSIRTSALEALPAGEFYWRDLIGLGCRTLAGRNLGRVEEIWPTGSNDVLVVRGDGGTLLVPALRDVLVRVEQGELWIDPPAGLLEGP